MGDSVSALYSQERIPTDGPCKNSNDSLFFKVKGKWIKTGDVMIGDISLPHRQEAVKRVDEFHKMIAEIYPHPQGLTLRGAVKRAPNDLQKKSIM